MMSTSCIVSSYTALESLSRPGRASQQSGEQHFVHAAAKPLFAVDFDNGHALVVLVAKRWLGIDIDQARPKAVTLQNRKRFVAQMAALTGVKHDLGHGWDRELR